MNKTQRTLQPALVAAAALLAVSSTRAGIGYSLDVTTHYQFGAPIGLNYGSSGGPDTGFWTISNSGLTTFTGTIGQTAVSQFAGDFSYSVGSITLAPGASVTFGVNPESSNVGGFNGPFGSPQPGIDIFLNGLINGSEAVNLDVHDSDVHSGFFRINPYGVNLDNYVLQGGDPLGRDTGDGYETTQTDGHYRFFEEPTVSRVPEAGSTLTMLGMTATGLLSLARARRK